MSEQLQDIKEEKERVWQIISSFNDSTKLFKADWEERGKKLSLTEKQLSTQKVTLRRFDLLALG